MFIERYTDYLVFEKRFSPHTVVAYKHELSQLISYLEGVGGSVSTASYFQLRAYFSHLVETGHQASSVNRSLSSLRTYFNFLIREGHLQKNPVTGVRALKKPKRLPVVVEHGRLSVLLDTEDAVIFPEGFSGLRDRLVLEFLFGTGVRLAELLQIKVGDIDFYAKQVRVLGKRSKERIVPLTDTLIDLIRRYTALREDLHPETQTLFLTDKGEAAYHKLIYRIVRHYLAYVSSQDKRSPHVLRHTFATALLDQGADLNAIKELLGHAGLSATQVYTHNSVERLKNIYNQAHPRA